MPSIEDETVFLTREEGFLTTGDFAGEAIPGEVSIVEDCAASAAAAAAAALERGVPVVATTFLGPAPPPKLPLPVLDTDPEIAGERFPFVLPDELDLVLSNPSVPKLVERFRESMGDPRRERGELASDLPLFDGTVGDWECEGEDMEMGEEGVMDVEIF